ncbi:MAG: hypothetical protein M1820_004843 [Bogoriella megaspora]|nr:MAG: hypothetical protein M1820_004843 [Bogoriella megaspora]
MTEQQKHPQYGGLRLPSQDRRGAFQGTRSRKPSLTQLEDQPPKQRRRSAQTNTTSSRQPAASEVFPNRRLQIWTTPNFEQGQTNNDVGEAPRETAERESRELNDSGAVSRENDSRR